MNRLIDRISFITLYFEDKSIEPAVINYITEYDFDTRSDIPSYYKISAYDKVDLYERLIKHDKIVKVILEYNVLDVNDPSKADTYLDEIPCEMYVTQFRYSASVQASHCWETTIQGNVLTEKEK